MVAWLVSKWRMCVGHGCVCAQCVCVLISGRVVARSNVIARNISCKLQAFTFIPRNRFLSTQLRLLSQGTNEIGNSHFSPLPISSFKAFLHLSEYSHSPCPTSPPSPTSPAQLPLQRQKPAIAVPARNVVVGR